VKEQTGEKQENLYALFGKKTAILGLRSFRHCPGRSKIISFKQWHWKVF